MNIKRKRKLLKWLPLPLGCLLAFLSLIKPIMILAILPILIMNIKRKLKENRFIILFLIGFFIVYPAAIYAEDVSISEQINRQVFLIYNILKNEIIDTNLESIGNIREGRMIDNFEQKNEFILEKTEESVKLEIIGEEFIDGAKSLSLKISAPTKKDIFLQRKLTEIGWNEYSYMNIWIKNKNNFGWFGVILIDKDGDWWHYDNNQILTNSEWTLLKIPLASFKNYEWTKHGNRKMDQIVEYKLKFAQFEKTVEYTVFIDSIYLSEF